MELYGLHYNNYYNRTIKRENSLTDYLNGNFALQSKVSFNPNDGITTEQIVNNLTTNTINWENCDYLVAAKVYDVVVAYNTTEEPLSEEDKEYLIQACHLYTSYTDAQITTLLAALDVSPFTVEINCKSDADTVAFIEYVIGGNIWVERKSTIESRWFILECQRTRSGQYSLQLKRDVVADALDEIQQAPMFIDKATVPSTGDPAIYNQEGMIFNEIKKSETLIKDELNTPWLVGYFAPNQEEVTDITITTGDYSAIQVDSLASWEYYRYVTNDYNVIKTLDTKIRAAFLTKSGYSNTAYEFNTTGTKSEISYVKYAGQLRNTNVQNKVEVANALAEYIAAHRSYIMTTVRDNLADYFNTDVQINGLNGRFIFDRNTGTIYSITVNKTSSSTAFTENPSAGSTISAAVNNNLTGFSYIPSTASDGTCRYIYSSTDNANVVITGTKDVYRISLNAVTGATLKTKISAGANTLRDAPYKMFAIPYGKVMYSITESIGDQSLDKLDALNVANAIAVKLGQGLYDLQIVPYCPVRSLIKDGFSTKFVNLVDKTRGQDYDLVVDNDDNDYGIVVYPKQSKLEFEINYPLFLVDDVVEQKIGVQCDNYRLVSPNGSADFSFNLVKTGGISKFNVDCTYKPYSPYIHVAPDFGALYGHDFNDYRGLICAGEFSIPVINSQWQNYQIQNKNYQLAFDREITSLEINQKHQRIEQGVGIATGSIQGGAQGAMTGSKFGGYGAIIGAAAGAATGIAGGAVDYAMGEEVRKDTLSAKHDFYNYNLQNIQARPNTLVKSTALDANNKLFPYLEYYSCTDEEKNWFKSKMKYEGMTIGRIDKLTTFLTSTEQFIRGSLVRCDNLKEDTHFVQALSNELAQGVYIKL